MLPARLRNAALVLVAFVASAHAVWCYGLPSGALLIAIVALGAWYVVLGAAGALVVTASLVLGTLALWGAIEVAGLERAIYYRPHEMLEVLDTDWGRRYKARQRVVMKDSFGDLAAIDHIGFRELREVEFVTDALGFRNRADYDGRAWVLLGDSMVAGAGNTQDCLLSETLARRHGIGAYTLAHPGDGLPDYEARLRTLQRLRGDGVRALAFVYEDNDFLPYRPASYRKRAAFRRYEAWLRDHALYRYTRSLYVRAFKRANYGKVTVKPVAGGPMAFMPSYVEVVRNARPLEEGTLGFGPALAAMRPGLAHVFFVPGKYRVYGPLAGAGAAPLPHAQWEYLERAAKAAGVPATDLTPALVARARELAGAGRTVFWRDDSHWNCEGTAVVAAEVTRALGGAKPAPPAERVPARAP